jgi:hypothetical protein
MNTKVNFAEFVVQLSVNVCGQPIKSIAANLPNV